MAQDDLTSRLRVVARQGEFAVVTAALRHVLGSDSLELAPTDTLRGVGVDSIDLLDLAYRLDDLYPGAGDGLPSRITPRATLGEVAAVLASFLPATPAPRRPSPSSWSAVGTHPRDD